MSKLPIELADIASLEVLDISFNSFIALPQVCFKIPKLKILRANNNAIIGKSYNFNTQLTFTNNTFLEIDTEEMVASDKLELVDLRHNPFTRVTQRKLLKAEVPYKLELSEVVEEDW